MSGPEFHQSKRGHVFFDSTLPGLVSALERIAAALEKQDAGLASPHKPTCPAGDRAGERALVGRPEQVWQMLRGKLPPEQEGFWVVAIDIRNGLLGEPELVALGGLHSVEVHPREVFREAVRKAAAGIVVAHNHPTGDPTPSAEDLLLTRRLRDVGQLLGVPVIDHLVLTPERFRSIAEFMGTEF